DESRLAGQEVERADVQVGVVDVRDEHGVEPVEPASVRALPHAPDVEEPAPQQWIGEQTDAVELAQDGAVPDPGDLHGLDATTVATRGASPASNEPRSGVGGIIRIGGWNPAARPTESLATPPAHRSEVHARHPSATCARVHPAVPRRSRL